MTLDPIESGSPFHWCNIFVCNTETRVRQGSRIAVARSYSPLYQTLIYHLQDNPHSSYEPHHLCESGAQVWR